MNAPRLAVLIAAAAAACAGPATQLDNPGGHRCFLDGVREVRPRIPFRYYGTTRVDVVPRDVDGAPDWRRQPASVAVTVAPPASQWLFPLDFLVEVWDRTLHGPGDVVAAVDAAPNPAELLEDPTIRPTGIEDVNRRAHAARIAR